MKRAGPILKNTAANYVQQLVNVAVFMFLTPYAARKLGTEQFGLWSLMWAMVGVLALADMGISSSVVKFISDARGRQSPDRLRQLYSTFFWVQSILATTVLLAAFIISPFLAKIFDLPPNLTPVASLIFLTLSFRVATGMPFGLFTGLLSAHRKQAYSSLIKAASTLVYGFLVFIMLRYRPTAVTLAGCNLAVHILSNVFIIMAAKRVAADFSIRFSLFNRSLIKEISTFSGAAVLVQISSLLYSRVDIFIIQRFLSLANVARYSIAMQTIDRGTLFCRQLTKALTPLIAEMKGAEDKQSIRLILRKGTKLNTALTTPLLGGLIWLAPDLIESWMGPDFSAATQPMRLLAAAAWISTACELSNATLTMTNHQKLTARLTVVGQVFNIILSLFLVRSYGMTGVATASLIAVSTIGLFTVIFTARCLQTSFWRTYSPVLACAVPLALMYVGIIVLHQGARALGFTEPHLMLVALEEAVGCIIFFIAFFFLGLSSKERKYYLSKLKALRKGTPRKSSAGS